MTRFLLVTLLIWPWPSLSEYRSQYQVEDLFTVDSVIFGEVTSIAFGKRGQLLVLDQTSQSYVVIDIETREAVRQVGGRGEGPGEFIGPSLIAAHSDTGVAVLDARAGMRISTFLPNHDFSRTFQFPVRQLGVPIQIVSTSSDYLVVTLPSPVLSNGRTLSAQKRAMLARLSEESEVLPLYEWDNIVSRPVADQLFDPFPELPLFAYLEGDGELAISILAVASNTSYAISLLNTSGKEVRRIAPDVKDLPFPEELKQQVRAQFRSLSSDGSDVQVQFPEYLAAIVSIFPGPPGTLVVVTGDAHAAKTKWDLWSVSQGEQLGSLSAVPVNADETVVTRN